MADALAFDRGGRMAPGFRGGAVPPGDYVPGERLAEMLEAIQRHQADVARSQGIPLHFLAGATAVVDGPCADPPAAPPAAGPAIKRSEQATDVHGATLPDVHVVPLGDRLFHVVPGGYWDQEPADVAESELPWLTTVADAAAGHVRECECFPSVRAVRTEEGKARVLVHHAFDRRPSGQQP